MRTPSRDVGIPICLRIGTPQGSGSTHSLTGRAPRRPSKPTGCDHNFNRNSRTFHFQHLHLVFMPSLQFSREVMPQKQIPFKHISSTLSTSTHLTSPASTSLRTSNYEFPTVSPLNDSTNSNVSTSAKVLLSPSPLLSSPSMAYRGKHFQGVGSEHRFRLETIT